MKIDIRNADVNIHQIDFSSEELIYPYAGSSKAFTICKGNVEGQIDICDSNKYISLDVRDFENFIAALKKAVDLGWTK